MSTENVPKGLYRNSLGVEMHVVGVAMSMTGFNTLAGDIAIAESRDDLFGTADTYLVTEASLAECGYKLIAGEDL